MAYEDWRILGKYGHSFHTRFAGVSPPVLTDIAKLEEMLKRGM